MQRTVSSSEAQNNFGAMIQWAEENAKGVVVERRGKPTAVILSYEEYRRLAASEERARKLRALEALRALRDEIAQLIPEMTEEEAYREAGMSERVIQEILENDEKIRRQSK